MEMRFFVGNFFVFSFGVAFLSSGNLRGGEALKVAKAVSPPRAPPLRPRNWAYGIGNDTPWRGNGFHDIDSDSLSRLVAPDGKHICFADCS